MTGKKQAALDVELAGLVVPVGQVVQAVAPAPEYILGGQIEGVRGDTGHAEPGGHGRQAAVDVELTGLVLPTGQGVQAAAPAAEKVAGKQVIGKVVPAGQDEPAGHR